MVESGVSNVSRHFSRFEEWNGQQATTWKEPCSLRHDGLEPIARSAAALLVDYDSS